MLSHLKHLADFHLAERCLGRDSGAIEELQSRLKTVVVPFVVRAGAPPHEAAQLCEALLTDLVMPAGARQPRLFRYEGSAALDTWLRTVALNAYLDGRRKEQFEHGLMPTTLTPSLTSDEASEPPWARDPNANGRSDQPLLDLMLNAIEQAFKQCPPEDFVLLQLAHCDRLHTTELGVMFRCSRTRISHRLALAEQGIAASVLNHIRETDPWLDLTWEDFTELCRTATPACFGLD